MCWKYNKLLSYLFAGRWLRNMFLFYYYYTLHIWFYVFCSFIHSFNDFRFSLIPISKDYKSNATLCDVNISFTHHSDSPFFFLVFATYIQFHFANKYNAISMLKKSMRINQKYRRQILWNEKSVTKCCDHDLCKSLMFEIN